MAKRYKVITLIRGVGPSSMPWNDLYRTARSLAPGRFPPPVAVGASRSKVRYHLCSDICRAYVKTWPGGAIAAISRVVTRNRGGTILHVHNPILAFPAALAKLLHPSIKIVTTQHNEWRFFKAHQRIGLHVLTWISDQYVCCGRAIAVSMPETVRSRLESTGKLSAIPNGINPEQLSAYARSDTSPQEVTAVVVARLVPQKNGMFIIRLMKEVSSIDRLIWFGDGPQRDQIEAEIKRLGIQDRIELRGRRPREEVLAALSQSTLYLAASKWEGLSVADLEAAALGCWPIMSNIPQREEVAEAINVPLFPLSSTKEWASAIDAFLNLTPSEQEELRKRIEVAAKENFDLNVTVGRYVDLYQRLASGGKQKQAPA